MNPATIVRDRIRNDLKTAMRARDMERVRALRSALGAIDNAEAVPTTARAGAIEDASVGAGSTESARLELTAAEVRDVVQREVDDREAAANECAENAPDRAERLRAEAAIIAAYASDVV